MRSLIIWLAQTGLFRAKWSEDVHMEWISNLIKSRPDLVPENLESTRRAMDDAVPDCLATEYSALVPILELPDPNDRHILAAAICSHASVLVTFNLTDFPDVELAKYKMHAKHPDDFILDVFGIDEDASMQAVQYDLVHYKQPKLTVDSYIESLVKAGIPQTADFLRERKVIFE